jgi:hypothetical protein
MSNPENIVARTMLHNTYVSDLGNGTDAIVVSEIVENEHSDTRPNLRIIKSPKVSFWVTQPQYRNHTDKKELEELRKLDEYIVPYKDKDKEIFKVLNGFYPNFLTFKQRKELYQSPYLYGANIDISALVGIKYKQDLLKANRTPHTPTTGFFDIEKSLIPATYGKLPLMAFVAEDRVYLAMKQSFMYEERNGKMESVSIEDVEKAAHEYIDPLVENIFATNSDLADYKSRLPFKYHFFAGETEVDMIKWIWSKMHETQVSFIGIWNLGFDIPEIIAVLDEAGIAHKDVFSHPSLKGTPYSYASFHEDKRKVAHFTQKWHWLSATGHCQFVDSMALYSYIRTVDGKEASYALDDILKKYNLGGKLKIDKTSELEGLQTEDWHRAMLGRFFTLYAVYAMWDSMSLQLLEWRNNDLTSLMLGSDISSPKYFPNQTIRATNTLFEDWKPKGFILGTGTDVEGIRDDDLLTAGGAVLSPQNLVAKGVRLFKEWPNHHTHCYVWLGDVDFAALYPSLCVALNISRQTKVSTILAIKAPWVQSRYQSDVAIETYCSYLITPDSTGYELGTEFYNLPTYSELDKEFEEYLKNK